MVAKRLFPCFWQLWLTISPALWLQCFLEEASLLVQATQRYAGEAEGLFGAPFYGILKTKSKALSPSVSPFSSSELSLFELGHSPLVLCAEICWPHKCNKDFLIDFSKLLVEVMRKYNQVFIIGDFNVHICCTDKPMVKGLFNLKFGIPESVFRYRDALLLVSFTLPNWIRYCGSIKNQAPWN